MDLEFLVFSFSFFPSLNTHSSRNWQNYKSSFCPSTQLKLKVSHFFSIFSFLFLHFSASKEQICFPAKPEKYNYDHLRPLELLNTNNGNSKQHNRTALSGKKGQDFASHISSAFPKHCFLYSWSGKTSSRSTLQAMSQSTHDSDLQNLAVSFSKKHQNKHLKYLKNLFGLILRSELVRN